MPNISIYLTQEQQKHLDMLIEKEYPNTNRSSLIGILIEREIKKLTEADMIADAIVIDDRDLGWNDVEEECQIIDSEVSG